MDGYSVTEAASVLGVPAERVWELLARGVLSGTPDGGTGMRVFLQPRAAPPALDDQPRRSDGPGDARQADVEASPFRELLTEFRNLTERYGQALLALGEARGEVASLRSRVDVLEARMDLRLPMSSTPIELVPPAGRMGEPPQESERDSPPETEPAPSRRRGRPHFSDGFAEALARAADPNPAVLRGGAKAVAAPAEVRPVSPPAEDRPPSEPDADASLPRELPAAEPIAVDESLPSATPVVGLDLAATTTELDSTTASDAVQPSPNATEPEPPAPQQPRPEPGHSAAAAREAAPEVRAEPTWDQERYTTQIAEPDWWMPEESFWSPPEPSAGADAAAPATVPEEPKEEAVASPAHRNVDAASDAASVRTPPGEETVPSYGRPPDGTPAAWPTEDATGETGVVGAGRRGPAPLPGGEELREALASLSAAGGLPEAGTSPPEAPDAGEPRPGATSATAPTDEVPSPAARAYRRLRRIFPG